MTEWQITVDSDQLPDPPSPNKPPPSRWYRRWLVLAGAIVVLLVAMGVTLYRQRTELRTAMRGDLIAFMFEEESLRFLGRQDQAAELMMPSAQPGWQRAYLRTFETAGLQPPKTQPTGIDFDGQCALVNANLAGHDQIRSYCLYDRQWRRAPVPASTWSGEQEDVKVTNNLRLGYQARDRAFASALANDLPLILARLEQLVVTPDSAKPGQITSGEIVIEPYELRPPLISAEGQRIVLNSPLLVPFDGRLPNGQVAVRVALGQALLHRYGIARVEVPRSLPGGDRFHEAVLTVMAMDLMLDLESTERLFATWQAQLGGDSVSPFFAREGPAQAQSIGYQADLAAYLTAGYILRSYGLDTLQALLQDLPTTESWDNLFSTALDLSTVALETQVEAYLQGANSSLPLPDTLPVTTLPLQATLLSLDSTPAGLRAYLDRSGPADPILVDMQPGLSLNDVGGSSLPPECVVPGASVEVDGEWLEAERRLQASQVVVQGISPVAIDPAPEDTVAYLVVGEFPARPESARNYIFPSNRSFFSLNSLLVPQALVAVRQDGTAQPLTPLSATLRVVSLPVSAGESAHFLFIVDLPRCDRSWFVHYEPQKGVTGQWLGPSYPMNWVWRADRGDLMLFDTEVGGSGHNIYQTDEMVSFQSVSRSETLVSFSGWNTAADELVFVKRAWQGATGIGFLDPDSGGISRAKIYVHPLRARRLSPNGSWLAYLTGARNRFDPPYRLDLLNLNNLTETTLLELKDGHAIGPAIWSLFLAEPQLAVLAGPLDEDETLLPTRLLVTSPDQPATYVTVAEVAADDRLAAPTFCPDGGLLYRVDHDGHYQLRRQQPDREVEQLLTLDRPFQPVACP
jgi:hypothetical protein